MRDWSWTDLQRNHTHKFIPLLNELPVSFADGQKQNRLLRHVLNKFFEQKKEGKYNIILLDVVIPQKKLNEQETITTFVFSRIFSKLFGTLDVLVGYTVL